VEPVFVPPNTGSTGATMYARPMRRDDIIARAVAAHHEAREAAAKAKTCTAERNALWLEAWRAGAGMAELAKACGVTVQAVSSALGQPSGRHWHNAKDAPSQKAEGVVRDLD
jgi:hypothetical protein